LWCLYAVANFCPPLVFVRRLSWQRISYYFPCHNSDNVRFNSLSLWYSAVNNSNVYCRFFEKLAPI